VLNLVNSKDTVVKFGRKCLSKFRNFQYLLQQEFTSKEFMDLSGKHGIKRHLSVVRTPQKNTVVERKKIKVQEMARTMLKYSKLSDIFWEQVIHKSVHILKR
jgi:hypothetical protein